MRRFAVLVSMVLATLVVAPTAADAHQLGRGGPVITCPTVGIQISVYSAHSLHIRGFLRVGNNSHTSGHNFYARVHFWTRGADRYFEVRDYLAAFSYKRYRINKFIYADNSNDTVHWNRTCYPTN